MEEPWFWFINATLLAATWIFIFRKRAQAACPQVSTSDAPQQAPVTVSAPGKVLITGGYQVLEKPRSGIVIAGDSRFHTTAQWRVAPATAMVRSSSSSSSSNPDHVCYVVVRSSQFATNTCYHILQSSLPSNELCRAVSVPFYDTTTNGALVYVPSPPHNPYVQTTLSYCFTALLAMMDRKPPHIKTRLQRHAADGYLEITLNADNCFYSQQQTFQERDLPLSSSSYEGLEPFARPTTVSKTGLGSSATLVSSLVGALMISVGGHVLPNKKGKKKGFLHTTSVNLAHQLAQVCHVVAQGKVGSGFDVCSAIYGSICYERYTPTILQRFTSSSSENESSSITSMDLLSVLNQKLWDHRATPFGLPDGYEIILGDIAQGSSTPSMVRKVLAWRKEHVSSQFTWDELNKTNKMIFTSLEELRLLSSKSKKKNNNHNSRTRVASEKVARDMFRQARSMLKEIGVKAGVDIEPDEQTELCTATMDGVKNVIVCGVPGAGGNDAVFAIYYGGEETRHEIELFWETWRKEKGVSLCAMPLRGTPHGEPGLRVEV